MILTGTLLVVVALVVAGAGIAAGAVAALALARAATLEPAPPAPVRRIVAARTDQEAHRPAESIAHDGAAVAPPAAPAVLDSRT